MVVVCEAGRVFPAEVTVPHLVQLIVFVAEAVIVTKGPDTVPVGTPLVMIDVAAVVVFAEVIVLLTVESILTAKFMCVTIGAWKVEDDALVMYEEEVITLPFNVKVLPLVDIVCT